jgi:flagellar basal body-associated protein FliL
MRIALQKSMAGENPKPSNPPRRSGFVVAVLLALGAAAGTWYWTSRANETRASASPGAHIRSTLHLETFILNLADADQRSYLRVGIDLGLSQEPSRDAVLRVAKARDVILEVLAQGKVEELTSPGGKAKLKENLLHALEERVPELGVEEVYYTEFLIQR